MAVLQGISDRHVVEMLERDIGRLSIGPDKPGLNLFAGALYEDRSDPKNIITINGVETNVPSTGDVDGPHIYFAVRQGNIYVLKEAPADPVKLDGILHFFNGPHHPANVQAAIGWLGEQLMPHVGKELPPKRKRGAPVVAVGFVDRKPLTRS